MEWPVDPKPPREPEDEPELVEVLVPVRPVEVRAVETAIGALLRL